MQTSLPVSQLALNKSRSRGQILKPPSCPTWPAQFLPATKEQFWIVTGHVQPLATGQVTMAVAELHTTIGIYMQPSAWSSFTSFNLVSFSDCINLILYCLPRVCLALLFNCILVWPRLLLVWPCLATNTMHYLEYFDIEVAFANPI